MSKENSVPVRKLRRLNQAVPAKQSHKQQPHEFAAIRYLYELSTRPVSPGNLKKVMAEILDTAITLSGADMGAIQLPNEQAGTLEISVHQGFQSPFLDFFANIYLGCSGHAPCGVAYEQRQRVLVEDVRKSPIFTGTPALPVLLAAGVMAIQATPLISRDGLLVGLLSTHYRQPLQQDTLNLHFIDLLACQAADIIVLVQAEAALRASEEKYRLLFESMYEGFVLMEMIYSECGEVLDLQILDVNPAYELQTGRKREEVLNKRVLDFSTPVNPAWFEKYKQVSSTGQPLTFEEYAASLDRWMLVNAYSPAPGIIATTFTDITARKRAEMAQKVSEEKYRLLSAELYRHRNNLEKLVEERTEELKRSERQYRTLIENIPMVISRYDTNLRYLYAASQWEDNLGVNTALLKGKTWQEIGIPEDIYRPWQEKFYQALHSRSVVEFESQYPSAGEKIKDYRIQVIPELDEQGQVESLLTVTQDITERKKIDAELQRLDRLNTVGEMAAAIGHEVRNPLTTVRGYLQMFQRKTEINKYREQFAIMIEELDRANTIITDFLSLAKNRTIELKLYNLNDVITKLQPLLQAEALRTGHKLKTQLSCIPHFRMDEKEIRQLLLNLARNGFEAMEPGKALTIETGVENGSAELRISDCGPGIPPEVLAKLGTPFLTTKATGTGLGLAVCYRIADRHDARITVKTSASGTKFTVRFKL